jgi:hypothetical protein
MVEIGHEKKFRHKNGIRCRNRSSEFISVTDQRLNCCNYEVLCLKQNKEQKREMCIGALQSRETLEHVLGNTNARINNDFIISSSSYHGKSQGINSENKNLMELKTEPNYMEDVVLADPVLHEIAIAAQQMRINNQHIHLT